MASLLFVLRMRMTTTSRPLIVGAGPVGLGAALFLARQGLTPRIVEQRSKPSRESRALAVNPRTLEILEPTGVTQDMLDQGLRINGGSFHQHGRVVTALDFAGIHPRYPHMLALSQAATERLLARAFEKAGGRVERGVRLDECRNEADHVKAVLEAEGNSREAVRCSWLLAADGAHSTVRQQLGIDFPGSEFSGEFYLADVPLRTDIPADRAHVFFFDAGAFLFMIRVIDEAIEVPSGEPLWRLVGNRPDLLSLLTDAEPAGEPVWTSRFRVAHRMIAAMTSGRVHFAGDAAHIHSPVGARGMNLGLEDAWVFSELVRTGRLEEYDRLRRPIDRAVVRQVELLSRIATAESRFFRFARTYLLPLVTGLGFVRSRMTRTVTGLDHELPRFNVAA